MGFNRKMKYFFILWVFFKLFYVRFVYNFFKSWNSIDSNLFFMLFISFLFIYLKRRVNWWFYNVLMEKINGMDFLCSECKVLHQLFIFDWRNWQKEMERSNSARKYWNEGAIVRFETIGMICTRSANNVNILC